jgi:hypothetical protein
MEWPGRAQLEGDMNRSFAQPSAGSNAPGFVPPSIACYASCLRILPPIVVLWQLARACSGSDKSQ